MRARLYLHIGLWCALFAVFLVLSMPIVGPAILENKIGPIDPNHSTDSYLSAKLHRTYNIIAATSFSSCDASGVAGDWFGVVAAKSTI